MEGDIVPGKARFISPTNAACWAPFKGREVGVTSGFETLTNPSGANMSWQKGGSNIPSNAIAGGRTADRETLYISRCRVNGLIIPGNVRENSPTKAYYSYNGAAAECTDFDILVCTG